MNCLGGYQGESVLEIGVGSGILLKELSKRFSTVVGTDIDFESLLICGQAIHNTVDLICCDAAKALSQTAKYDLIISNPPYLPLEKTDTHDRTIYGGKMGSEAAIAFVKSALNLLKEGGAFLIVLSSLSNISHFHTEIASLGLLKRTISRKELFFESLSVEELRLIPKPSSVS